MAIQTIFTLILTILGVFFAVILVVTPFAYLFYRWRLKRLSKKIPEKMKRRLEHDREQKKAERGRARRRYELSDSARELSDGFDEKEDSGVRREFSSLKPADSSIPRIRKASEGRSVQVLSPERIPDIEQNPKRNWAEFD